MASFDFTSTALDEGTTFIFGSWICVANGSGGFKSHLADTREPEASAATQRSRLNEFFDNLDEMLLPDLAREIEEESIFDAILTRATPGLLGSDSIRSGKGRTRILFGLHNAASVYQEPMRLESLSDLEEDLDRLLKIGEGGATVCWEAPIFDKYSDLDDDSKPLSGSHLRLTITSTSRGRFVY
jgi:hypothetical protein